MTDVASGRPRPEPERDAATGRGLGGVPHDLLDRVVDEIGGDRATVVRSFAAAALRRMPTEQVAAADFDAAALQLADAFRFVDGREPGELGLRVFTPPAALDGWSDPGTVVEANLEDRPFLLSTVTSELEHRGHSVVRALHPVIGVERDADGRLVALRPARTAAARESFLHIELDTVIDDRETGELEAALRRDLDDAVAATRDFAAMRDAVLAQAERLREHDGDDAEETALLLDWLLDDNFVLLGCREYRLIALPDGRGRAVEVVPGSGRGILADDDRSHYSEPMPLLSMDPALRSRLLEGPLLSMSRTNALSTVHRRVRMEDVAIRIHDAHGEASGAFRLLGLITRKGFTEPASTTPVLRHKLQVILEREDVVRGSHDEMTLVSLFQALPKDELFHADVESLHRTLLGLFRAEEQRETQVVVRAGPRDVSVLLALPQDSYSPALRDDLRAFLGRRLGTDDVQVDLSLGDRAEAVVRFTAHLSGDRGSVPDLASLEAEIRTLARSWLEEVTAALVRARGDVDGRRLVRAYAHHMPVAYRDLTPPEQAVEDVGALDRLAASDRDLAVRLHPDPDDPLHTRLKAYKRGPRLELSAFLPIIESLGLLVAEEVPHTLSDDPGQNLCVHDFAVRTAAGDPVDVDADGDRLAAAAVAAWRGALEVDALNALVLAAGLTHDQVAVLRAYRRYRRQVGTAYSTEYINEALVSNPEATAALWAWFAARFDPDAPADVEPGRRDAAAAACDDVVRLDHDRILRSFAELIGATVRTNHYRSDRETRNRFGAVVPYLALKLDPSRLSAAPSPVPSREIFVYSPVVEGVHLRGGPVARGGIRWSDRRDDVRTEILGLLQAQMLKNALIVPTGAKGGFVVKHQPDDPRELREEVRRRYVTFVEALLDVTDDVRHGRTVAPARVRAHDGDDPYLVVAADRGTAAFSDVANELALARSFWLGDAFASGGSRGYDHKALGITARGAWLAVARHFRELGMDVDSDPVRVVGIGDMSGDVFGNAMLCSRSIRLVAAFDHRDIFLDPDPDAEASCAERQRLFDTGGSWQDYDRALLGTDGGVWSRDVKRIELTGALRAMLRVDAESLPPQDVIRAILCAPVDLLFAGGIGTFVRATEETDEQVGDRANDEVRVDAAAVRARVVGEGANLSFTPRARVQYARRGGRINTDFVDNAGGVAISDREVNLKILLDRAVEAHRLDRDERDGLLAAVTDDVVSAVLRSVDRQTRRISKDVVRSPSDLGSYSRLIDELVAGGHLDRELEALPSAGELRERADAGAGLTRPEVAVLVGCTKRWLVARMLRTDLPSQAAFEQPLSDYFPEAVAKRFPREIREHPLHPELIASVVANEAVDRMGVTFVARIVEESATDVARVLRAFWVARTVAGAPVRWDQVTELEHVLDPVRLLEVERPVDALVARLTRAYVADGVDDIATVVERDRPVFDAFERALPGLGRQHRRVARHDTARRLTDDLVPDDLAAFVAGARELVLAPLAGRVLRALPHSPGVAMVGDAMLRLLDGLHLDRLLRALDTVAVTDRWARLQRDGLAAELRALAATTAERALRDAPDGDAATAVGALLARHRPAMDRVHPLVAELPAGDEPASLDAIAVAVRALRGALGG